MSQIDDLYQKAIRAAWDKKDQQRGGHVVPISSAGKTKLKSVVFGYAEGAPAEKGPFLKKPYHTWSEANRAVSEMAHYSGVGGYDKTDFTVTWQNGDTYEGNIGVEHKMTSGRPLSEHIASHLRFVAGTKPTHLTEEQYQRLRAHMKAEDVAEAINMLAKNDIGEKAEISVPRKPSGPTFHEKIKAEDAKAKAAVKAKFDKYPPAVTDRNEAIAKIKTALQKRSGKQWSVTGGKGTAWGWIHVSAPPKRLVSYMMTEADAKELAKLLGKERVSHQYEGIPAGGDYRTEYVDRAEGREPRTHGVQYWD